MPHLRSFHDSRAAGLRCALLAAPWALLLTGCGPSAVHADDLTGSLTSSSEPAGAPTPSRAGLEAPVVWRDQPRAAAPAGTTHGSSDDVLALGEVRADADRVYFDVSHKAARADGKHEGSPAELFIRADRCKESKGRLAGTVWRDWTTPSTVSASLVDLPDGELDLTVRAFGAERTLSFLKRGRRIETLTPEKRAGHIVIPADPAHGIPRALSGLVINPCRDEVMP